MMSQESNPEVMNKYVAKMGWPTGEYRWGPDEAGKFSRQSLARKSSNRAKI